MKAARLRKLEKKAGISNAPPEILFFRTVYKNRDGSDGETYIRACISGETPEQCYSISSEKGEDIEAFKRRVTRQLEMST